MEALAMEALARYLHAAIGAMTGAFGSPEIALLVFGVAAGLLSGPFSYAGRRALARIQALQLEIRELKAKHGDDSHALQRDLLELYRRQSTNPWSPLLGFIPAVIEIGLIVLVYVAVGIPSALLAPAHLSWFSDLSSRDPYFVLAGLLCLLLVVRARANILSNPPRQNRLKLLLHLAVPAAKVVVAAVLPSGVVIAWLAYAAVTATSQLIAAAT
jgi:YidC/Oxa1 family membrane protein insertase